MSDFDKLIDKASEPAFYMKVMFLALETAQQVASEPPETEGHAGRVAYANRVFRGEEAAALLAAHAISANPTIQASIIAGEEPTDNDLRFVLASIWSARAQAFETDLG